MASDKVRLDELRIDRTVPAPKSSSRALAAVVLTTVILGAGFFWWWKARPGPAKVRTYVVRESVSGGAPRTLLNGSGYVTPRREATVSSKLTGKVAEVLVEEGMRVERGQILARLDSSNVEANLRVAQAQQAAALASLQETQVRLEEAELELRRASDLARNSVGSQADLDRARAEAHSLKARLDRQKGEIAVAEQQVALWQQQLDDNIIRAPFAGVVVSKNAQPGEMISPMSAGGFTRTGICTIVDMDSLEVEVDVNESYINRVEPGQPVEATLDSYPDWKIPAKVIAIIPTADRQKATVKVRVGFEKLDPRILPQMGVKVAFREAAAPESVPARGGMGVPRAALRKSDGRDVVLLLANGRAERRAVTVSELKDSEAIIAAGLSAGERVIVEAPGNLSPGDRVEEIRP